MIMETLAEKFQSELTKGRQLFENKDYNRAFHHFERAHILGQPSYIRHVRSHYWMLRVGLKIIDFREVVGQIIRILGSAGSLFGKYPVGNTGGANVSPFKPMPIPDDLKPYLE
ncbi:hypothetical protein GCM10023150_08550 [Kangiella taiwanensis]|uniref:DUF3703 domain-containing protein n=2 Tax=Kangiella taiwanensis TaxID=1079179 RepID=A0ABP8HXN9_9GAMM